MVTIELSGFMHVNHFGTPHFLGDDVLNIVPVFDWVIFWHYVVGIRLLVGNDDSVALDESDDN